MTRGRTPRRNVRVDQKEGTAAREQIERAWFRRIESWSGLEAMVTGEGARTEPYHRWLPYTQGFSPELVRVFLMQGGLASGPVLDPFAGSGTTVIECARQGRDALGLDAVEALAFLGQARFLPAPPPWGDLPEDLAIANLVEQVEHPSHRAALLFTASRLTDARGREKRDDVPHREHLLHVIAAMASDTAEPLAGRGDWILGDARSLPLADQSIGGVVTSPPYLTRYDYARVNDLIENLYRKTGRAQRRKRQIRARSWRAGGHDEAPVHDAVAEAARALEGAGKRDVAQAVRAYFADLRQTVCELFRVAQPGAPVWIVIGSSDLHRQYVPTDVILAELAVAAGFSVDHFFAARFLRHQGRRLGGLKHVAPRESLLVLRRP